MPELLFIRMRMLKLYKETRLRKRRRDSLCSRVLLVHRDTLTALPARPTPNHVLTVACALHSHVLTAVLSLSFFAALRAAVCQASLTRSLELSRTEAAIYRPEACTRSSAQFHAGLGLRVSQCVAVRQGRAEPDVAGQIHSHCDRRV